MKVSTPNFLTFDIEEWYHANYKGFDNSIYKSKKDTHLPRLVNDLLGICEKYDAKATFFVVGSVGKRYPAIVKEIVKSGHEIASHSMNHDLIYEMTPKQFENDLIQSKEILESVSGKKVIGFRAPSWSVNEKISNWYYEKLLASGYRYSSSVFPAKNFLYGIANAPLDPYRPKIGKNKTSFTEIPCSVYEIAGKRFGFSGGFYLRAMPKEVALFLSQRVNSQGRPVVFYLHPREIDQNQKRIGLPYFESFIHYQGVTGCKRKLDYLVSRFQETFGYTMGEYVNQQDL